MGHNRLSRPQALWTNASVPNARDFERWDTEQFRGIDGDNGGTWLPLTSIGLGGAGVQLSNGSSMAGGFLTTLGGRLELGANDFPVFSAGNRTRLIRQPLRGVRAHGSVFRRTTTIAGRPVTRLAWIDPSASTVWLPIEPRVTHDGGTLTDVTVRLFMTQAPPVGYGPSTIFQMQLYTADLGTQWLPTASSLQWIASHAYTTGQIVFPLGAQTQTGLYYQAQSNFTSSGSGQPSPWGTVLGGITNELSGGGTWKAFGYGGTLPMPQPYNTNQLYNAGLPFKVRITPITPTALQNQLVASVADTYALAVTQDTAFWGYSSAELTWSNLPSMAFE